ncbi:MAG: hypothetical protein QF670_07650 [Alphaproteobacteria bacterium]|nr:hypothetical protein [Alphaproteobacteria bacterium]MEE1544612.1 hypothetical protein [Alphaproteobacteria bacterium]
MPLYLPVAAQLKFDIFGGVQTLYVAELTLALEAVEVTIWREGDIFHGLAGSATMVA